MFCTRHRLVGISDAYLEECLRAEAKPTLRFTAAPVYRLSGNPKFRLADVQTRVAGLSHGEHQDPEDKTYQEDDA